MKILVLNCVSSSIKYKLYNMDDKSVMAAGGIEKVGLADSFLKIKSPVKETVNISVPTHDVGVELIFNTLTDPHKGCIKSLDEINAVGHRIAHGGKFTKSLELTPEVLAEWKKYESLAPLHNPAHLKGINAVTAKLPNVKQVGVFDTSFHQTMPDYAYTYALPYEYYETYGIRRYGFHGTSHRYVLARAAELYGFDPKEKNIITCHIGNGASIAAIKGGKCVDNSRHSQHHGSSNSTGDVRAQPVRHELRHSRRKRRAYQVLYSSRTQPQRWRHYLPPHPSYGT